jgi:hypothetical protein
VLDVQSYQAYDEGAAQEVLLSRVEPWLSESLDRFIGFIDEEESVDLEQVVASLRTRLAEEASRLAPVGFVSRDRADGDGSWRERFPDLFLEHARLIQGFIQGDTSAWTGDAPTPVRKTTLVLARYVPRYLLLKALVDVVERDAGAVDRMKRFLDWEIARRSKSTGGPETIAEMRERDIRWNRDDKGQDAVTALVSEHQCLKKVTACRIHRALAPYGDGELMELVACYPDFASIRRTNEHFALTRTQNLIAGGSYCDTCFHDERYIQNFAHPSREVFERL